MRKRLSTIILALLLIIVGFLSLFVGVLDLNISNILEAENFKILLISRLPRLLAVVLTGIGMSISGLIMQQLCMNKFVSPSTGATISSAQLGILVALIFIPSSNLWSRSIIAFSFSLLGTWIFVLFVQRLKFKNVVMVPLVGIMLGNVISGITSFLAYKFEMTQALSTWLSGHFSTVIQGRYELVYLVLPLVIIAYVFANHFNIVGMGKDFAKNLGVNYNIVLFIGLTICAMITASVVVVVGSISYLGLIIPNLVSMFKGDKLKGSLIDTGLFGALFVLVCDIFCRIIIFPYELPIDLIIGIVGSIIFIIMIIYRLKNGTKAIDLFKKPKEDYNVQKS